MLNNPFLRRAELQFQEGSLAEALRTARMGLSLFPADSALLELAGTCASSLGDDEYALGCWQRWLELEPAALTALNNRGLTLHRLQRPAAAEAAFLQALALYPEEAALHSNFGLLLESQGRLVEAERAQRRAGQLAPRAAEIWANLAGVLLKAGREEEAESLYRQAIRLQPEDLAAYSNLAVLLSDSGRPAEAEACFRRALSIAPDYLPLQMNLGQLLLQQGRLSEGWPYYEGRQHIHQKWLGGAAPSCPQWQGQALAGQRIVVMPEQGLGDEIQFSRYLPWLKAQGAAQVTLVCRPSQKALLQTLPGPDLVLDLDAAPGVLASHDYWVFLLSLPRHAGTELASIPATIPYLFPDPQRVARLAPLLAGAGRRVGLVWWGNPRHANDESRSLPDLQVLAPLWAVAGQRFFSLQKGAAAGADAPAGQPLTDLGPALADFADTAAVLSQLDLLITVDTAVAHLAGALGRPCWLLLPCYKTDWRWLLGRSDSPWYPSLRLFRQERRGDWQEPVARLAEALRQLPAGAGGT